MVAFLAHDEGAVACEHDVDRLVELGSLRGAVLLARRSITGDGGDVTCRADGADGYGTGTGAAVFPGRGEAAALLIQEALNRRAAKSRKRSIAARLGSSS